jgi:hypothetical protein
MEVTATLLKFLGEEGGRMSERKREGGGHPQSNNGGATDLVSVATRGVTAVFSFGRITVESAVGEVNDQARRMLGAVRDLGGDLAEYVDPAPWLDEVYAMLGIASSESVSEMDERVDEVVLKVDDVARQRAREELMLLQQRIGELESVLDELNKTQARTVMSNVLGRLSQLEARIDTLPVIDTRESRRLHP